ncbi:hypothetical protein C0Q70_13716 [Pomacea canaliculata]|uniref:Uncharacterized protein n=1 Tax=Pomacea canaliculata TaxID=400727 RepID=A0A2T7NXZ2_POMCA|nr:hypothetical protein C0Q70_13716 [Pomacea canaliculata]
MASKDRHVGPAPVATRFRTSFAVHSSGERSGSVQGAGHQHIDEYTHPPALHCVFFRDNLSFPISTPLGISLVVEMGRVNVGRECERENLLPVYLLACCSRQVSNHLRPKARRTKAPNIL